MLKKDAAKRPSVHELLGSEALRSDVIWARERAAQLTPGIDLPPLPLPTPLLRQLSTLSTAATLGQPLEDDVLAGYDGAHTPVREGHGGICSLDRLMSVQEGGLLAGGVEACGSGRHEPEASDGSGETLCGKELLGIAVAHNVAAAQPFADATSNGVAAGSHARSAPSGAPVGQSGGRLEGESARPQSGAAAAGTAGTQLSAAPTAPPAATAVAKAPAATERRATSALRGNEANAAAARPAQHAPAVAAGTKRTRRASAMTTITTTTAAATAVARSGTQVGGLLEAEHRSAGAAAASTEVPAAATAGAASAAVAGAVRPRAARPRAAAAPHDAGNAARHGPTPAIAAGSAAGRGGVATRATARPASAPTEPAASGFTKGSAQPTKAVVAACPAPVPLPAVSMGRVESMDVDGALEPPPKKRSSPTARTEAGGPEGGVSAAPASSAAAAVGKGMAVQAKAGLEQEAQAGGGAKPALRPWRTNSTLKARNVAAAAGAGTERHGSTAVAAVAAPKYRDAAKAVAAAAEAAAATAAAQSGRPAQPVKASGSGAEAATAPCAALAAATATEAAAAQHAATRPTGMTRTTRVRTAGVKASPARRTTRSNSSGGKAANATSAGEASTATSGAAAAPAVSTKRRLGTAAARPITAAARGKERASTARAPLTVAGQSERPGARHAKPVQMQGRRKDGAVVAASTCSGSEPSTTPHSGMLSEAWEEEPAQRTVESRARRTSYMSASGQLLCEEFSMLSLPPRQPLPRSNSCSSLPGSNPPSARSERSQSTAGGLSLSPSPSPSRLGPQQMGTRSLAERMQAATPGLVGSGAGDQEGDSRWATPMESELSPAVGASAMAYAAVVPLPQPPQLFDNQLFQSPNSRKASSRGGSGDAGGADSPTRSSMSGEVIGPERVVLAPGEDVPSSLASGMRDAWGSASDALECPASFADLAAAGATARSTCSLTSSASSSGIAARCSALPPGALAMGDATAVIVPSGGVSELSFAGFKTGLVPGACVQPASVDTAATPAFPQRSAVGAQPATTGDAMSVSFASHTDLMSVTRRLEMPSDDQASSLGASPTPGSLGKWMAATPVGVERVGPVHGVGQYRGGVGRSGLGGVLLPSGLPPPSHQLGQPLPEAAATAATQAAEGGETEGMKERLELLERVVDLASRLHAMGRWHELGSVLSSTQPCTDTSTEADGSDAAELQQLGPAPVPWITSPGGGSRALNVGDKVIVGSRRGIATIRYYGPTHWASGEGVGKCFWLLL